MLFEKKFNSFQTISLQGFDGQTSLTAKKMYSYYLKCLRIFRNGSVKQNIRAKITKFFENYLFPVQGLYTSKKTNYFLLAGNYAVIVASGYAEERI